MRRCGMDVCIWWSRACLNQKARNPTWRSLATGLTRHCLSTAWRRATSKSAKTCTKGQRVHDMAVLPHSSSVPARVVSNHSSNWRLVRDSTGASAIFSCICQGDVVYITKPVVCVSSCIPTDNIPIPPAQENREHWPPSRFYCPLRMRLRQQRRLLVGKTPLQWTAKHDLMQQQQPCRPPCCTTSFNRHLVA